MKARTRRVNSSGAMPSNRLVRARAIRSRPSSPRAVWSPASSAANSGAPAMLGSACTAVFSASTKKSNWTYVGRSHHSVPSLSKQATRSSTGTSSTASRNATSASRAGPGRHDGNRSSAMVLLLHIRSKHAAEADVAHAGVDGLRATGGRAVAQAVGVRTQVGAALDHLAADAELRLGAGVAPLEVAPPGILRRAARRAGVLRVPAGPPVVGPLPHVAGHVEQPEPVGREAAHGCGPPEAALAGAPPGEVRPVPGVGLQLPAGPGLVSPGVRRAVEAAARGVLPLGLGRQGGAGPGGVGRGVLVGHVHHRMVKELVDRALRAARVPPAGAR